MSGRCCTGPGVGAAWGWEEGVSTFQHLHTADPVPRTLGYLGWDEGMGAQLKWELEAKGGGVKGGVGGGGESVYCGGKRWGTGLAGAAGQAAARRLPARGYAR